MKLKKSSKLMKKNFRLIILFSIFTNYLGLSACGSPVTYIPFTAQTQGATAIQSFSLKKDRPGLSVYLDININHCLTWNPNDISSNCITRMELNRIIDDANGGPYVISEPWNALKVNPSKGLRLLLTIIKQENGEQIVLRKKYISVAIPPENHSDSIAIDTVDLNRGDYTVSVQSLLDNPKLSEFNIRVWLGSISIH
jgi:hypothetical protein